MEEKQKDRQGSLEGPDDQERAPEGIDTNEKDIGYVLSRNSSGIGCGEGSGGTPAE